MVAMSCHDFFYDQHFEINNGLYQNYKIICHFCQMHLALLLFLLFIFFYQIQKGKCLFYVFFSNSVFTLKQLDLV